MINMAAWGASGVDRVRSEEDESAVVVSDNLWERIAPWSPVASRAPGHRRSPDRQASCGTLVVPHPGVQRFPPQEPDSKRHVPASGIPRAVDLTGGDREPFLGLATRVIGCRHVQRSG